MGQGDAVGCIGDCRFKLTWLAALLLLPLAASPGYAASGSALPRYDLDITIDTTEHKTQLRERVTWTNTSTTATDELVFNFYPHYCVPQGDYLKFAKTLEMMR